MAKANRRPLPGPLRGDLVIAVKCIALTKRYDPRPDLSFQRFEEPDPHRVPPGVVLRSPAELLDGFLIVESAPPTKVDEDGYNERVNARVEEWLNRITVATGQASASGGWWHWGLPRGNLQYGIDLNETPGILLAGGRIDPATLDVAMAYSQNSLQALRIPLNRYRASLYEAQDPAGVAVDIAIAWESLLLRGDDSKTEISFRLALRGAHLVGGSAAERRRTFDILKRAYDTRSQIVHSGWVDRDERELGRQTREAMELFAIAARKLLTTGLPSKDDWMRMLLGSD